MILSRCHYLVSSKSEFFLETFVPKLIYSQMKKFPPQFLVGGQTVKSTKQISVLGVIFGCTLNWAQHVNMVIMKANSTKFAIRMIAKFFDKKDLKEIITAYYYSILYYNADIWLIPSLSPILKQMNGILSMCCRYKLIVPCLDVFTTT